MRGINDPCTLRAIPVGHFSSSSAVPEHPLVKGGKATTVGLVAFGAAFGATFVGLSFGAGLAGLSLGAGLVLGAGLSFGASMV